MISSGPSLVYRGREEILLNFQIPEYQMRVNSTQYVRLKFTEDYSEGTTEYKLLLYKTLQ